MDKMMIRRSEDTYTMLDNIDDVYILFETFKDCLLPRISYLNYVDTISE